MRKEQYQQRMYILVPFSLSGISKGIQALHAAIEYSQLYHQDEAYQQWAREDKTVILLNGGTMNEQVGTLMAHLKELQTNEVKVATFREPDLNDAVSAVAFLVDERVWDTKVYKLPEYPPSTEYYLTNPAIAKPVTQERIDVYNQQVLQRLGSEQNVFLREFLKQFKRA